MALINEKVSLPHFSKRESEPNVIVLHSCYSKFSPNFFCYKSIISYLNEQKLSYHFLISRSGQIFELVDPDYKAWHAGESFFPELNINNLNDSSIGISLIATETSGYSYPQTVALYNLLRSLFSLYPIRAITSHAHIAPQRKSDPWNFDWQELKRVFKSEKVLIVP
ncbi:MAG: N-acetylmuramoyl-L-alanine amidase [Deltaproteobacteria bacterium]|nr:N-acetylmuramoyl-L-alanine amidase [Deltaproteobacteria bacterium]